MSPDNRKLCETSFTIDWLRDILLDSVHLPKKDHQLTDWSTKRVGVGQGFLSVIMQVELKWNPDHQKLPKAVVVKVPTLETINSHMDELVEKGEDQEKMNQIMEDVFLPTAHKNECNFYDMFGQDPPLPTPKSFYSRLLTKEQPGVLVMEDFSLTATTVNIADGLRLEQVLNIAQALASLHAHSLQLKDWEDKFQLEPKESFEEFPKMMATATKALVDLSPELYQEKLEKIEQWFDPDYMYDSMLSNVSLGLPAVLVQGDMWTNNLMFKPDPKQENGAADQLAAVIDWQTTHPGNMTEDISRVLVSSTSANFRRKHGPAVLRHYFDRLSQLMKGKVPFTFEDVLRSYKRILPYAMCFFVFALPMMFNSPVVDGPNKEKRKKELLERGAAIMNDVIELHEKTAAD